MIKLVYVHSLDRYHYNKRHSENLESELMSPNTNKKIVLHGKQRSVHVVEQHLIKNNCN